MNQPTEAVRVLTPQERFQALMLASMNQERADLCSLDQPALREFFLMNAALLLRFAQ